MNVPMTMLEPIVLILVLVSIAIRVFLFRDFFTFTILYRGQATLSNSKYFLGKTSNDKLKELCEISDCTKLEVRGICNEYCKEGK